MIKFNTSNFAKGMTAGFDKLEAAMGEKTLRSAAFVGAEIFKNEATVRAPVRTGVLKANIIVKRIEELSDGNQRQVYFTTVRTGKKNKDGDAFYWKWVEFGTSKMAARPFMRPAYETKKHEAIKAMKARLRLRLKEALSGKAE